MSVPPPTVGAYARPIVTGLAIVAVAILPWLYLARINAQVRPDLPWAAVVTIAYLTLLFAGLHRFRRPILRDADGLSTGTLVALFGVIYLAWIVIGRMSPVPDLSAYPTTAYRWSMFLMGGLTAGVVEEIVYRGHMQPALERIDSARAIWITSAVFVASHITQGIGAVLILGPGLFAASVLYGLLARRTGSILPGMAIHVIGDLAHTFFGVLRGDASFLFVDPTIPFTVTAFAP